MSPRARAWSFGLAAVVLFALPLLPEILGARRLVFRDAQITHWPWRRVAMEAWREHRVPFINASASGGEPLLANPNAVLLYPTVLLETFLPPASAFNLHYLLHILWALFGARALARRLGLSPGPAFLAGVAYAFSGVMLSYGSAFMNSAAAAAWLPWCCAALLDLARSDHQRSRIRAATATALGFALQALSGEPAISLLTAIFGAALALAAFAARRRTAPRPLGTLLGFLAAGIGAFALSAPLLLPLAGVLRWTYRGQHVYSLRAFGASPFAAWRFLEWLFPRFSGDPGSLGPAGHWQYALHPGDLLYIWCVSFGVVPLLLVASAALSADFWDRRAGAFAAAGAVSLLFAFGSALPFYRIFSSIQWLRRLRYPIKFYLLTTICMALLTGLAAEFWKRRRARRRERIFLGAVSMLYVAALFLALSGGIVDRALSPLLNGLKAPTQALLDRIESAMRGDALFGLVACAVVALAIMPRRRAPAEGYFLALATLLLALPWGLPLFVSGDERSLARPPAILSALRGSGRLFVSPKLPEFNVLLSGTAHPLLPERVGAFARVQVEELIPETAAPFGVHYLFDGDPDGSYGFFDHLAAEAFSGSDPVQKCRLLRAFGARWTLEDEGDGLPCARPITGFSIAGRRLIISNVTDPLPEIRWASNAVRASSLSGALDRLREGVFDPRAAVVLPGRPGFVGEGQSPKMPGASLSLARVDPNEASVEVEVASSGYLVLSRTFFAAWKARIDGAAAPIIVANAHDMAVGVPPGRHTVRFFYDQNPFYWGVSLQALALLTLAAAVSPRR